MKDNYESGKEGSINTKNFPDYYDASQNYYWTVAVPEGKRIEIRFQDVDIESSANCAKDFLKIHDGRSTKDAILQTYCGRSQPATIRSNGRYLYLYFRSDGSREGRGFKLYWRAIDGGATTTAWTTTAKTTSVKESEGRLFVLIILSLVICNRFDKGLSVTYDSKLLSEPRD